VRVFLGDTAGARSDAREGVRASRGDTLLALSMLAYTEAVAGDSAAARRHVRLVAAARDILEEATARAAAALAVLGDTDGALALLERARRNAFLRYYLGNPDMDPLRSEPRFQRLAAALQAPGAQR
jgi:hypothetical protein